MEHLRILRKTAVITLILLCTINLAGPSSSYDYPDWELTIEIEFDKQQYNLSKSLDPITFHGWVNYTGYSATPLTVHLDAYSEIGDVWLSQYDFTFHLWPDSIPFDGKIPIDLDLGYGFTATPTLTICGYVEQGGIRTNINPQSWIIPICYYEEENESVDGTIEQDQQNWDIFSVGILSFFIVTLVFITIMSGKEYKKRRNK